MSDRLKDLYDTKRKQFLFNKSIKEGIHYALREVRQKYDLNPNERERLTYHNYSHSKYVLNKVGLILSILRKVDSEFVSARDIQLGRLSAAFHDIILRWEEVKVFDDKFHKVIRRRFFPNAEQNEKLSADEAIKFMEGVNVREGIEVFTEEDKTIVRNAIEVTIPSFDTERNTIVQPHLSKDSHIVTKVVGFVDLGAAGLDTNIFLEGGDGLFREDNIDVYDSIHSGKPLTEEKKEYLRARLYDWSAFQPNFAKGRKKLLEEEIELLPIGAQKYINNVFNLFTNSIENAKLRAERRKNMTFEEIAKDMGYRFKKSELV